MFATASLYELCNDSTQMLVIRSTVFTWFLIYYVIIFTYLIITSLLIWSSLLVIYTIIAFINIIHRADFLLKPNIL
jgi:hypothetical protein